VSPTDSRRAVAIVTGGASHTGRDVARGLASRAWAIVVVYLEHQSSAEATVAEIIAAEGTTVTVRADLADDLDVERLFAESIAAFGGVDVVVHTTNDSAALLYRHGAQHVRPSGAIVSTSAAEQVPPGIARQLRERGITVGRPPPEAVLRFLEEWRRRAIG
jgi:NAD(P)-dependent dehydrogenase (short-subunit alcohol dehydrogenase family)